MVIMKQCADYQMFIVHNTKENIETDLFLTHKKVKNKTKVKATTTNIIAFIILTLITFMLQSVPYLHMFLIIHIQ